MNAAQQKGEIFLGLPAPGQVNCRSDPPGPAEPNEEYAADHPDHTEHHEVAIAPGSSGMYSKFMP